MYTYVDVYILYIIYRVKKSYSWTSHPASGRDYPGLPQVSVQQLAAPANHKKTQPYTSTVAFNALCVYRIYWVYIYIV